MMPLRRPAGRHRAWVKDVAVLQTARAALQAAGARAACMAADLQGAAIYLCSPASNYVTGQTLYVDGGFSAK